MNPIANSKKENAAIWGRRLIAMAILLIILYLLAIIYTNGRPAKVSLSQQSPDATNTTIKGGNP
jgi:hypothetical protein